MTETISVIIPAFNQKKLLEKCIRALSAQNFPNENYDIIIVDDGSTDGTGEMVIKLQSGISNLKYFRQENRGPGTARNFGLREAGGSIIAFTDSDCIPATNWLKSAIPYFNNVQTAGIEGKTVIINPEDNTPFSHYAENTKGGNYLTCNIFYRREILKKTGGFDERFKLAIREDSDLAFLVLETGGLIQFSPETIVKHPAAGNPDYSRHFKKAREGYYDALLYKKHPRFYRKKLNWYDGWAFPVYYYGYYLSIPLILVYLLTNNNVTLFLSLLSFISSHIITIIMSCRKKKVSLKYLVILFIQFLVLPFARFYWVMRGNIKFKTFVW